jgi:LPS export ABC transporter protein LptC
MVIYSGKKMGNLNKIRNILAFVLLAASVVLAAAVFFRYASVRKKEAILSVLPKDIDVSLQKLHYSEIRKGIKQWDLDAEKAQLDKKKETVDLQNPRLTLYLEKEPRIVRISADRARYELKSRNVALQGNVSGTGGEMSFSTGQVTVLTLQSRVETEDHVRIVHGGSSLEGDGMEVRTDTGTVTIHKNVSAMLAGEVKVK